MSLDHEPRLHAYLILLKLLNLVAVGHACAGELGLLHLWQLPFDLRERHQLLKLRVVVLQRKIGHGFLLIR